MNHRGNILTPWEKEAINRIITALAEKGQPDKYLIAMKYLDTMTAITSGENNKVVYIIFV